MTTPEVSLAQTPDARISEEKAKEAVDLLARHYLEVMKFYEYEILGGPVATDEQAKSDARGHAEDWTCTVLHEVRGRIIELCQ